MSLDELFKEIIIEAMVVFCFRYIIVRICGSKKEANAFMRDFVTKAALETDKRLDGMVDSESVRMAKEKYIRKLQV